MVPCKLFVAFPVSASHSDLLLTRCAQSDRREFHHKTRPFPAIYYPMPSSSPADQANNLHRTVSIDLDGTHHTAYSPTESRFRYCHRYAPAVLSLSLCPSEPTI